MAQKMKKDKPGHSSRITPKRYEKLYGMLLNCIPSSVLMIDRAGRVVEANENFLKRSHRYLSKTLGYRLEEIFPAPILQSISIDKQIQRVFETNKPTEGQRMTYRAPGVPLRFYYYRIFPFSYEGNVEQVILLMDDITEQVRLAEEAHRAERHLASVFESASDMVLSTDTEGRILSWNPAAEKFSGYVFLEVRGRTFSSYLSEQGRKEMAAIFNALKNGADTRMVECELIAKDGRRIYASWVCSPLVDQEAHSTGVVAVGRDLTERRKLELQLLQSQKFAALGVMAGGIAHEIRNPLAICSSAAQFLMEDDIDAPFRKECARKIHGGIERASKIIENLLRFARPAAKTETQLIDVTRLIQETHTLISNQARIQKIELPCRFPECPAMVTGNGSLLQQVLINLFLNAIRVMPDGGVLQVVVETSSKEVVIVISDTGWGIPKESIPRIFDPFYTTSPVGKGTGLGLSLSYSIVEQHGGDIEVESTIGRGSAFTVRLPLADARASAVPKPHSNFPHSALSLLGSEGESPLVKRD